MEGQRVGGRTEGRRGRGRGRTEGGWVGRREDRG